MLPAVHASVPPANTSSGTALPRARPGGRLLLLYAALIGPLLGGYLMFDKAFAYLRPPAGPLYVSELLLGLGVLGTLSATGYLRAPVREEALLALLGMFSLWGLVRTLPGIGTYGMDALRDAALWYYSAFAFLVVAAAAKSPALPERLVGQFGRLVPWMLLWLPISLLLVPLAGGGPYVPFSTVSVFTHKSGNAAVAAALALGYIWLFRDRIPTRRRAAWSLLALLIIALAATQNRGGLLGSAAGLTVGLALVRDRVRLATTGVLVIGVGVGLATLLSLQVPVGGLQGRAFSASQLVANVVSLGGKESPGNLGGTVEGRQELWSRVLSKQVHDRLLGVGSGFGPNLAADVGVYDQGTENLRNPHNSHLNVLARMGLLGFTLWVALWLAWYWRLITGCRRLKRTGQETRWRIAVLCLMGATAVLVSSIFDPQLEGPQVAALLWTTFGIGVTVTSARAWVRPSP